jgi:hypothetical protein
MYHIQYSIVNSKYNYDYFSELLCETLSVSPQCKDRLDESLTNALLANIPRQGLPLLAQGISVSLRDSLSDHSM